ncbi:hypothetical protein BDW02DRAFT_579885 [Decorospora gaudefroyi]|uniref:CFEM domain-containing protein n=1 Tax=Decorospora gaudefroyi TaxID=184978 RepID=A0A6A5K874_9PLEO|nr:hypothetical protein BDW02DRAFT_579885 [Decorospora gaudefroyi]
MRASVSVIAVVVGAVSVALASPITPAPVSPRQVDTNVAGIGPCPIDCWNQAAVTANCDPNADDDCLCGPFFDAVTACTAAACGIGDNLGVLNPSFAERRTGL